MERFVSRFTPSLTPPATLEAMFVQRHDLAADLVERVRESTLTDAAHYSLLIGPRGIGKTHLVSLVYHRVKALDELSDDLAIAWLHEEEWGVASFLDLLLRVLRALHREYRDAELEARVEALYAFESVDEARAHAEALLEEYVGDRTLLVIAENLDDIFDGLGSDGQGQFRAYLQEHPYVTLLATSQSLFPGVAERSFPFYGFFRTRRLRPFSLDDAAALLRNIAAHEGKDDLAEFIDTADGRARIRAVHHLAGGNPRVYVILSQFLTRESLDALVEPFMLMLDDLTPYYQSRMASLSAQQRKIVEVLLEHRATLPVKQIANRCFITPQTASGQLKKLTDLGYVVSHKVGRESYYELREPLMRFSLEVKKQRGEPIRLFIDFLRIWYTRSELEGQLGRLRPDAGIEREYLVYALTLSEEEADDPIVEACKRDLHRHVTNGEVDQALEVADELIGIRGALGDWAVKASVLLMSERFEDVVTLVDEAAGVVTVSDKMMELKMLALIGLGRADESRDLLDHHVWNGGQEVVSSVVLGVLAMLDGKYEDALGHFQTLREGQALREGPADPEFAFLEASALVPLRRYRKALSCLEAVDEDEFSTFGVTPPAAAELRAKALIGAGEYEAALDVLDGPVLGADDTLGLQRLRALAAVLTGDDERGWSFFEADSEDSRQFVVTLLVAVVRAGRWEDALDTLHRRGPAHAALERVYGSVPDEGLWTVLLGATAIDRPDLYPSRVRDLAATSGDLGAEPFASSVLPSTLHFLTNAPLSTVRAWRDAWADATADRPAFALANRVLNAAVAYRETEDETVLLDLPIEEREVIRQALGLADDDPDA